MWTILAYASWVVSAALVAWLLYDWLRTDTAYPEETLTSSREGEIEAVAEKHQLEGEERG